MPKDMPFSDIQTPKFVIASTGRSGTGYISRLLRKVGVNCGHEEYYGFPWNRQVSGLHADASWLAVARLDNIYGKVLHQVRHPLDVISSLYFTYPDNVPKKFHPYRYQMIPGGPPEDPLTGWMQMYVSMNDKISKRSVIRYQVETMDSELLREICKIMGVRINRTRANWAVETVPTNVNTHTQKKRLSWSDLPPGEAKEEVLRMARAYGYITHYELKRYSNEI